MKNSAVLLLLSIIIVFVLGCGMIDRVQQTITENKPASNTTQTNEQPAEGEVGGSFSDQAIEQVTDGGTTGVRECDDVIQIFTDQLQSKDESWMSKAAKDYFLGKIKDSFRASLEKNQNDKTKLKQECTRFKQELVKHMEAEKAKQQ